jgi:MSHA pilin protein MshA
MKTNQPQEDIMKTRREEGFTLIELIMVIVILGILAAVAIPKFVNLSDQADMNACKSTRGTIASSASIYYADCAARNIPLTFPSSTDQVAKVMADGQWPVCPGKGTLTYNATTGTATCSLSTRTASNPHT